MSSIRSLLVIFFMKKLPELCLAIIMFGGLQPVLANNHTVPTSSTQPKPSDTNQMVELAKSWGFEITNCRENVTKIEHDVTKEIACITPNEKIQAGRFIYDSKNNKINAVDEPIVRSQPTQTNNISTDTNETSQLNKSKLKQVVFDFDNAYDYGACLDTILLSYEGRTVELQKAVKNECAQNILNIFGNNLSKDAALELVKKANTHATEGLEDTIYPSLGLRRRVAINLGFVYDIDKNNQDILKYIK
jgi:hypothetical protein